MTMRNFLTGVCAVASVFLTADEAMARQIVIDSNPLNPITPCSIGAPCTATPLGFTADFGGGSFSGIYIYDNGLVSLGNEIAAGADLSALSTIGTSVLTAGYSPGMTLSNFAVASGNADVDFPGRPVIRVRYNASFAGVADSVFQFDIYDVGGGDYQLQFDYGDGSLLPDIANDAYLGYHIVGGSSLQLTGQRAAVQADSPTSYVYRLPGGGVPTVPEPATWAMMIIGFGLAGSGIRQTRRQGRLAAGTA
jgi:hypothetical protein